MDRRKLSLSQIEEHLGRQLGHLRNSSRLYDEGDLNEAVRLGTTVRILMHHTGASHALLEQLGLREALDYVDTCTYPDELLAEGQEHLEHEYGPDSGWEMLGVPASTGLVGLGSVGPGTLAHWAPRFGTAGWRHTAFARWWETPAIETSSGHAFSRCDLVRVMANQDGGSHVDPSIDAHYDDFVREATGIMVAREPGDWTQGEPPGGWVAPSGNVAAASMRQIAWEMELTLRPDEPAIAPDHAVLLNLAPSLILGRVVDDTGD